MWTRISACALFQREISDRGIKNEGANHITTQVLMRVRRDCYRGATDDCVTPKIKVLVHGWVRYPTLPL